MCNLKQLWIIVVFLLSIQADAQDNVCARKLCHHLQSLSYQATFQNSLESLMESDSKFVNGLSVTDYQKGLGLSNVLPRKIRTRAQLDRQAELCREHSQSMNSTMLADFLVDIFDYLKVNNVLILSHINELQPDLKRICKQIHYNNIYVSCQTVSIGKDSETLLQLPKPLPEIVVLLSDVSHFFNRHNKIVGDSFYNDIYWLVKAKSPEALSSLNIPYNSNFYIFKQNYSNVFEVSEAYKAHSASLLITNPIGVWSPYARLIQSQVYRWERRRNLNGMVIQAATIKEPPFIFVSEISSGSLNLTGGFLGDIWNQIEALSNFSTKLVKSIDNTWGSKKENGSWNGMLGMLQRDEVDIAIQLFTIFRERADAAVALMPFYDFENGMFIKGSGQLNPWLTYIRPFDNHLWLVLFLTLCLAMVFYAVMTTIHHRFISNVSKCKQDVRTGSSDQTNVMLAIHIISGQGAPSDPSDIARRIEFFLLYLLGLIIICSYSGVLTSFLAVIQDILPFYDKKSLLDSDYTLTTVQGTYHEMLFQEGDTIERDIFKLKYIPSSSGTEAIRKLDTIPKIALFWPVASVKAGVEEKTCHYKIVEQFTTFKPSTMYVRKSWPYQQLINYHLSRMIETGQLKKLLLKWTDMSETNDCKGSAAQPLGSQTVSLFALLAVCVVLSFAAFLCELCVHKTVK